jgi:hypothetical protein
MQFIVHSSIPIQVILGSWIDKALCIIQGSHCHGLTISLSAIVTITLDLIAGYLRAALVLDVLFDVVSMVVERLFAVTWHFLL